MHPKPPDCTWKWTHGAKMLPFLPQKACMGRKCCQQRGLLRAFGEKGTHTARFLPDGPQVRRNARKGCEVLWGGMVGNAAEASNTAGSGVDGLGAADGSAGGQRRRRAGRGGAAARGLTARRARLKRMTPGRERSGLTRRNTPTRVAAIRPNWRALPQRALRALR